jgi:Winged helix DNA-binding domain
VPSLHGFVWQSLRMHDRDIAAWRLESQWVTRPGQDAQAVVGNLLGVQAENLRQSEWAVAARTRLPRADAVPALLADGTVIRTHVLRPTWHYALAEDIGWLLDLTAPRVRGIAAGTLALGGFDEAVIARVADVVTRALTDQPNQTRQELRDAVAAAGMDIDGISIAQILSVVELDQLICSGVPRDGDHTYALFSERVPNPRRLDREEALAEIVVRYVTGHGPATTRDLAYWATLGLRDVSRGLAAAAGRLQSFRHNGRIYWHAAESELPTAAGVPRGASPAGARRAAQRLPRVAVRARRGRTRPSRHPLPGHRHGARRRTVRRGPHPNDHADVRSVRSQRLAGPRCRRHRRTDRSSRARRLVPRSAREDPGQIARATPGV